jgi:hypothetical protein
MYLYRDRVFYLVRFRADSVVDFSCEPASFWCARSLVGFVQSERLDEEEQGKETTTTRNKRKHKTKKKKTQWWADISLC